MSLQNDHTEEFRRIISNIQATIHTGAKSVLITSTTAKEGKTFVAVRLAVVLAESGKKTLVIDFNRQNPEIHKVFELSFRKGISDYLITDMSCEDAIICINEHKSLHCITIGSKQLNFNKLLDSKKLRALFEDLKQIFDYILVDTPSLTSSADALILSQYTDTCLYIIESGKVNRKKVIRGKDSLLKANAHILGVILNKTDRYF